MPKQGAAHAKGKLYTALLGDELRPWCFLEFTAYRSIGVEFLDQSLRRSISIIRFRKSGPMKCLFRWLAEGSFRIRSTKSIVGPSCSSRRMDDF